MNWFNKFLDKLGLIKLYPVSTFVLTADNDFPAFLDDLAVRSCCSRAEVIRRAIGLYAHALSEIEQGKVLIFVLKTEVTEGH
jgi:hypothetical protein